MANKCTPKPGSFDCFLITNNSRWESKICMYKKAGWSCLSCLPRSLLLKQLCTFRSPGIDTSCGWTRTPCASPGRRRLEEGGEVEGFVPAGGRGSAIAGLCVELRPERDRTPPHPLPCAGQLHVSAPARSCTARKGRNEPWGNISVVNHFSLGVHCLPESQSSEQGLVLCGGAGDS